MGTPETINLIFLWSFRFVLALGAGTLAMKGKGEAAFWAGLLCFFTFAAA